MELIQTIWPSLLDGLIISMKIFLIVGITSIPLGFLVAIIRVYAPKWVGAIIQLYIYVKISRVPL